eukprot:jgi/Mesen1/10430/ME000082S09936
MAASICLSQATVAAVSQCSSAISSNSHRGQGSVKLAPRAGYLPAAGCSSSTKSSFVGVSAPLQAAVRKSSNIPCRSIIIMATGAVIQFIRGTDEQTVPDVKLTRSVDGTSGTATFLFDQPSVFDSSKELGDITGLYMIDEEGAISSVDVSAKFVNGKPAKIEARYVMRTTKDWDRFMRFMERYAEINNLGFVKK